MGGREGVRTTLIGDPDRGVVECWAKDDVRLLSSDCSASRRLGGTVEVMEIERAESGEALTSLARHWSEQYGFRWSFWI